MGAWGTTLDPTGKSGIRFLADPHSELTSALDLSFDGAAIFGNARSKRYALVVENGKVTKAFVEPDNTGLDGMLYVFTLLSCRIEHCSRNYATEILLTVRLLNSQRCREGAWQCLDIAEQSVFARQQTRLVHTKQTRVRQSIKFADRASRYVALVQQDRVWHVSCNSQSESDKQYGVAADSFAAKGAEAGSREKKSVLCNR
jgi:peroxiredoxin